SRNDISNSSSSLNYDGISMQSLKSLKFAFINYAEEFIKNLSKLDNLIGFKQLVKDFEIELPEEILIKALKLLSDALSFKYLTEYTMIHLEVHLRTRMITIERVYYSYIVLENEIRDAKSKDISRKLDVVEILPNITQVFNFKYPITY
ncbi:11491_t:CDS:2, partial [Dentiscutata erythropus]